MKLHLTHRALMTVLCALGLLAVVLLTAVHRTQADAAAPVAPASPSRVRRLARWVSRGLVKIFGKVLVGVLTGLILAALIKLWGLA